MSCGATNKVILSGQQFSDIMQCASVSFGLTNYVMSHVEWPTMSYGLTKYVMWYNQRSETGKGMKQGKWARLYRPELSVEPGALNGSATKPRVHFQFTKHVEPKPV